MIAQRDKHCLAATTRNWVLCWLCLCSGSAVAENSLQGKRLFFTHLERLESAQSAETVDRAQALVEPITSKERSEPVINDTVKKFKPDLVGIRLSAWVTGASHIYVLVNDVPCQPLSRSEHRHDATGIALSCPHINKPGIGLAWVPQKNQLAVSLPGDRITKLLVGDYL